MYCYDLEDMGSNLSWVNSGVHTESESESYLNKTNINFEPALVVFYMYIMLSFIMFKSRAICL